MPKTNTTVLYAILVVLLAAAAVLGYVLYQRYAPEQTGSTSSSGGGDSVQGSDQSNQSVLDFPAPDASDEEKKAHSERALALAKDGTVDITGCAADPVVLRATKGKPVSIKNSDSTTHELRFGADESYTIEANSTQEYNIEFVHGPGLYGYVCDMDGPPVGIMVVSQVQQ